VTDEALSRLLPISHRLDELLNRAPDRHAPYVGESAFATKAGIHASAIVKEPKTYEHVAPERVGNKRKLLVSDQAGRSNVLAELERIGLSLPKDDARVTRLLESRNAKPSVMPMKRRTPRSSSWRGARLDRFRIISTWRNSTSMSSSASMQRVSG
jgi:isopropylmalate/homocitrate/citramalate synthase